MSTTQVSAGQIMDRAATLLNDPSRTDYTYAVQLPYLNMAIEEFSDLVSEANHPFSNLASTIYSPTGQLFIPVGQNTIAPPEDTSFPPNQRYTEDLIEIQEIGERERGTGGPYRMLPRKEWHDLYPATNSLLYWTFVRGYILFNPNGATVPLDIELKYTYQGVPYAINENSMINMIGARTYLAYKTAALCAMFIGENETRAAILEVEAQKAVERTINISNKGKQQIMTRHRPFRASYKARGGF